MLLRTSSRSLVPSSLISSSLTSTQSHTSYHSSPLRSLTLLPFTLCIYILITLLCSNVITPVTAQAPFLVSSVNSFNVASYGDASVSSFRTVLSSSSTGVNGFILVNNVQFKTAVSYLTFGWPQGIYLQQQVGGGSTTSGPLQTLTAPFSLNYTDLSAGKYNNEIQVDWQVSSCSSACTVYRLSINVTIDVYAGFRFNPSAQTFASSSISTPAGPTTLLEGTSYTLAINPRNIPVAPVTLNVWLNEQSADILTFDSKGVALPGGGPLLSSNFASLTFDSSNWRTVQNLVITALSSDVATGPRWATIYFNTTTTDPYYATVTAGVINCTIQEKDSAVITFSRTAFLINTTSVDQPFIAAIGSQPRGPVSFTLTPNTRFTYHPSSITFTAANWSSPVTVLLRPVNNTVISGYINQKLSFPLVTSTDPNYNSFVLSQMAVNITDTNNAYASVFPQFGAAAGGTLITITYASPRTFLPVQVGETILPPIYCVFGDPTDTATWNSTRATITSSNTIQCLSTACGPDVQNCPANMRLTIFIRDQPSSTRFPFGFIPARLAPQVFSITPGTIDVAQYQRITIAGINFGSLKDNADACKSVNCDIGGIGASSVDCSQRNENAETEEQKQLIVCTSRPRPELSGSSNKVPIVVEITLNGQEYTTNKVVVNFFDYQKKNRDTSFLIFYIVVAVTAGTLIGMILQYFLCKNACSKKAAAQAEKAAKKVKGPSMLIEALEPVVLQQATQVREMDKELEQQMKEEQEQQELEMKKIKLQQLREEEIKKKEEKRRKKKEKEAAKQREEEEEHDRHGHHDDEKKHHGDEVEMAPLEEKHPDEEDFDAGQAAAAGGLALDTAASHSGGDEQPTPVSRRRSTKKKHKKHKKDKKDREGSRSRSRSRSAAGDETTGGEETGDEKKKKKKKHKSKKKKKDKERDRERADDPQQSEFSDIDSGVETDAHLAPQPSHSDLDGVEKEKKKKSKKSKKSSKDKDKKKSKKKKKNKEDDTETEADSEAVADE